MPRKFIPESPDPFLKTGADMAPAKFGHLNEMLRMTQREYADDTAAIAATANLNIDSVSCHHVVIPNRQFSITY